MYRTPSSCLGRPLIHPLAFASARSTAFTSIPAIHALVSDNPSPPSSELSDLCMPRNLVRITSVHRQGSVASRLGHGSTLSYQDAHTQSTYQGACRIATSVRVLAGDWEMSHLDAIKWCCEFGHLGTGSTFSKRQALWETYSSSLRL
ncbi:hypothetical protein BU26DRAFT_566548 [Trematosphaeria pertusa]|uniref:Uncharacterized protein n=1 Tax=Trematosphaeria pertusa TaxID=390896 RepID=A0A6A6IAK1_9PLEO|nr:uncharacterized protein BU26DRAFT_566548 [Trematosphaeria pertusa]KAF2247595.1 hypothetical protein BU26DRAFT_566548 [Trematosphaeria pertusa]